MYDPRSGLRGGEVNFDCFSPTQVGQSTSFSAALRGCKDLLVLQTSPLVVGCGIGHELMMSTVILHASVQFLTN